MTKRKFVFNFGDVNWIEYGGLLMFHEDGEYQAYKVEPCEDFEHGKIDKYHPEMTWEVHQFCVEKVENIKKEWYSENLEDIASFSGLTEKTLTELLISDDPINRLEGYEMIGSYHGFLNLDNYPLNVNAKRLKKILKGAPNMDLDLRFVRKVHN